MKKIIKYLSITIISAIITFITFYMLSWYHFGDIPTKVVTIRLIVFFVFINGVIHTLLYFIRQRKHK